MRRTVVRDTHVPRIDELIEAAGGQVELRSSADLARDCVGRVAVQLHQGYQDRFNGRAHTLRSIGRQIIGKNPVPEVEVVRSYRTELRGALVNPEPVTLESGESATTGWQVRVYGPPSDEFTCLGHGYFTGDPLEIKRVTVDEGGLVLHEEQSALVSHRDGSIRTSSSGATEDPASTPLADRYTHVVNVLASTIDMYGGWGK